jgi:Uma2 family endonuclease
MVVKRSHLFSVDEYERMVETGILGEDDRVELIRGEIIDKLTIGDRHAACVMSLVNLRPLLLAGRAIVSPQNPLKLAASVPEPDIALIRPRSDRYRNGKPIASDVLLLIEVADSSLALERTDKLFDYAQAGIRDYWIVNLIDDVIEVYRQPQPDGTYGDTFVARRGGSLSSLAFADVQLAVDGILG